MRKIPRKVKMLVRPKGDTKLGYALMLDTIRDGVMILDALTGSILYVNPILASQLGFALGEIVGLKAWELSTFRDLEEGKSEFLLEQPGDNPTRRMALLAKSGRLIQLDYERHLYRLGRKKVIQFNFHDRRENAPAEQLLIKLGKEMNLVYKAGQQLNRNLDLESLYDIFSELIAEMMTFAMIIISTYDPVTNLISCRYAVSDGKRIDTIDWPPIPLEAEGHGTQSRVIRTGKPWLIRDFQAQLKTAQNKITVDTEGNVVDPDEVPEDADVVKSALIVPVVLKEQVVGAVQIFNYQLDAFNEDDLSLAMTLTSQFAVASNNALLYQQAQTEISERKRVEQALLEREFWLKESQRVGRIGSYTLDLKTNVWTSSEVLDDIFGIQHDFEKSLESWNSLVYPEDREEMLAYFLNHVVAERQLFDKEYRIERRRDGVMCWVWGHGELTIGADGQVLIMFGTIQDVTERKKAEEELVQAYSATIEGWSRALDLRDKETEGHTQRVTDLSVRLARVFELTESEIQQVRWGALLHDIGKMGVPDQILLKAGPLTPDEWENMKRHPYLAYEMLRPIAYLHSALDIPYCHHEKWDGTGYPRGLKGEEIPLAARIFAVVDVWDTLNSDRPYRPAWEEAGVLDYLKEQSGTHFDPYVMQVCLESGVLVRGRMN